MDQTGIKSPLDSEPCFWKLSSFCSCSQKPFFFSRRCRPHSCMPMKKASRDSDDRCIVSPGLLSERSLNYVTIFRLAIVFLRGHSRATTLRTVASENSISNHFPCWLISTYFLVRISNLCLRWVYEQNIVDNPKLWWLSGTTGVFRELITKCCNFSNTWYGPFGREEQFSTFQCRAMAALLASLFCGSVLLLADYWSWLKKRK